MPNSDRPLSTLAFIGLGRMGKNMVLRLLPKHKIVVWNRSPEPVQELVAKGAVGSKTVEELIKKLPAPRAVWLMLPSGDVTEEMIENLSNLLQSGDTIIDGGNSHFTDSVRRSKLLEEKGISFLDIGVSGGLSGAKDGYCMMAGGDEKAYQRLLPFLKDMCIEDGYAHVGPSGAGHYVKMVHNAIEYGMMQSFAEGFDLLANGSYPETDLYKVAKLWNHGSIVRSFLLDCVEKSFEKEPALASIAPHVDDTGEGRWAAIEALEKGVPFTVNSYALDARLISRGKADLAFRLLAAMRNEFGGHAVRNA